MAHLLRVVALAVAAVAVVAVVGSLVLLGTGAGVPLMRGPAGFHALYVLSYMVWTGAGLLLVLRLPRNPIGWILLGVGASLSVDIVASLAITYTHVVQERPSLATEMLSAVGDASAFVGATLALGVLLVVFPDGRLPGRRWRWVPWAMAVGGMVGVGVALFVRAPLIHLPSVENPLGWFGGPGLFEVAQVAVWLELALVGVPAGVAALMVRWRRGGAVERRQIKWLLWVGSFWLVANLAALGELMVRGLRDAPTEAAEIVGAAIPVVILIAVTRYRLYEIDRIVSRTVTYVAVAALLVAVYVAGVIGLQVLLPASGDVAVAGSTLAVAALFNPVRRRVQKRVERRFNRARYDAERVVEQFTEQLRDQVDLEVLRSAPVEVVQQTMQPATVGVWLRTPPSSG